MKKPDLIKQLANRINQPHVIESWINKIEKASYNKGYKDAESNINFNINKREFLLSFLKCYNNGNLTEYGINEVEDFLKHYEN